MTVSIRLPFNGSYPITQKFGENPEVYSKFGKPGHNSIDFGMPTGTPIFAAADGVVAKIGWDAAGYGNYLILQHQGFQTLYARLNRVLVKYRDTVQEGDHIADSGNTGFSSGPHLHFELRIPSFSGAYNKGEVDPLQFVKAVERSQQFSNDEMRLRVVADIFNVRDNPSMQAQVLSTLSRDKEIIPLALRIEDAWRVWAKHELGWSAIVYDGAILMCEA